MTDEKSARLDASAQGPFTRVAGSGGTIGAIIAAMSCTACFPALASLASALGLSFLGQFEGVAIRYVLPLFAFIGLAANVIGGLRRGRVRMALGLVGPLLVLAAALLMAAYGMPTEWLLYPGLVLMIATAMWDLMATKGKSGPGSLAKQRG